MQESFRRQIVDILTRCVDMTVATKGSDGTPHATVVSFVYDGLLVYFGTGDTSQKARNIAADRHVAIAMTAPYASWREIKGLSISGEADEVTAPAEKAFVANLMLGRFPEMTGFAPDSMSTVKLFRVRPKVISILDYTRSFGHTDMVTVGADESIESLGATRHQWAIGEAA